MPEEDIDLYGEYEDDHYEEPVRFAPFRAHFAEGLYPYSRLRAVHLNDSGN